MNNEFSERLNNIEKALSNAINMNFSSAWQNDSFGELSKAVKPLFIQKLIEPNKNLIDLGGKRWRPLFLILCYEMQKQKSQSGLSLEQAYSLTPLVEFVHTASLIHDDIEDSADLRRGKPAAHIQYGIDTAINSASWLYFQASVCINQLKVDDNFKLKLYELYTNELRRLHLGQAMDIYWHREKSVFPQIDEYTSMVKNKTGTLASLAAQTGFLAAGCTKEEALNAGDISSNIGIGFQIIDDVINLTKGNPGKKRGDDIVEGKKSLPILIHIQDKPEDKEKISCLMKKASEEGIDSPAVEECIKLLETSDCIQKACEQGKKVILENCSKFKDSPLISDLFTTMIPKEFR